MQGRSHRFLTLLIGFFSLLLVVLLVGLGVAVVTALHPHAGTPPSAYPTDVVKVPAIPTPGSARTTYTNSQFGYSLHYPTNWVLKASTDGSQVRVFFVSNPAYPEAIAFDIACAANPNQLDAQSWWQQHQAPDGSQQGIGPQTLSSGAIAFVARGQGQTHYTIYTLVQNQTACQIITYETDTANAKIILASVNTFQWQ